MASQRKWSKFFNTWRREGVEELLLARDKRTMDQVQAYKLPSIYADVLLKYLTDKILAFYSQIHYRISRMSRDWISMEDMYKTLDLGLLKMYKKVIGRVSRKLKALLRAGLMETEESDKCKLVETMERMVVAEEEEARLKLEVEDGVSEQQGMQTVALLYAVVVSAVSLLLFMYQYLIGYIDKGGTKTCSSGSAGFRASFISVVLFEGAYVWIKFRDVASNGGAYYRPVKNNLSGTMKRSAKPEARYTPPGQSGNCLYLGVCDTEQEVKIKRQVARFYYRDERRDARRDDGGLQDEGRLDLGYDLRFHIPPMSPRQQVLCGSDREKRVCVKDKTQEVCKDFMTDFQIVHRFAAFYNSPDVGHPEFLEDGGLRFAIPSMSAAEKCFSGIEKENWVKNRVREVYEDFKALRAAQRQTAHRDVGISPCQDPASRSETNGSAERPIPSQALPVAFDPDFGVDEYLPCSEDTEGFCSLLDEIHFESPEAISGMPDSQPPQHLQSDIPVEDLAPVVPTSDNHSDNPPLGPLERGAECNIEVDMSALPLENCAPQSSQQACEFPGSTSPALRPQQGIIDPAAALSDMVTASLTNVGLPNVLVSKLISFQEQIQEREAKIRREREQTIREHEQTIREQDAKIFKLELENVFLRAYSTSIDPH